MYNTSKHTVQSHLNSKHTQENYQNLTRQDHTNNIAPTTDEGSKQFNRTQLPWQLHLTVLKTDRKNVFLILKHTQWGRCAEFIHQFGVTARQMLTYDLTSLIILMALTENKISNIIIK